MIYAEGRGLHHRLPGNAPASDGGHPPAVDQRGGLRLRAGEPRFYDGPIAFRFPLVLSGVAGVHEWFDDATQRFGIEVIVTNRIWGRLFDYPGWFTAGWPGCPRGRGRPHARPVREERHE